MPGGFGNNPFGVGAFGESMWEGTVLYEAAPEQYRAKDAEQGYPLLKWVRGIAPSFMNLRHKIREMGNLQDPLLAPSSWTNQQTLVLGKAVELLGSAEQQGLDGEIETPAGSLNQFHSTSLRLTTVDLGKVLKISGSAYPEHNGTFTIISIVDTTRAVLFPEPPFLDPGPLRFELRPVSNEGRTLVEIRRGRIGEVTLGYSLWDEIGYYDIAGRQSFDRDSGLLLSEVRLRGSDLTLSQPGTELIATSPTAAFVSTDAGKAFFYRGLSTGDYMQARVLRVIDPLNLVLDCLPTHVSDPHNGVLTWELREKAAFAWLELSGTVVPKGVVDQEGTDLAVVGPTSVSSLSARFTARDVGKVLTLFGGSIGVPGTYLITAITDSNNVEVDVPAPGFLGPEVDLFWELRQPVHSVTVGAVTTYDVDVFAHPPSMLKLLGENAGIIVDDRETDLRQRSWVKNVSRWIEIKGTSTCYQVTGAISGFDVTVYGLYRVNPSFVGALSVCPVPAPLFLPTDIIEYGPVEKFGLAASLTVEPGVGVVLTVESAVFTAKDVGWPIRISNSTVNNGLGTIASVLDSNRVVVVGTSTVSLPDYGVGGTDVAPTLCWQQVGLYVTKVDGSPYFAPTMPSFDEFNADAMQEAQQALIPPLSLPLDVFCWEPCIGTALSVIASPSTSLGAHRWSLNLSGPDAAIPLVPLGVPMSEWMLIDSSVVPQEFYVESMVDGLAPGTKDIEVVGFTAPLLGACTLQYLCKEQRVCWFCKSNKVLVIIEYGDIVNDTGVSLEAVLDRVVQRLVLEATPAHVELIVQFKLAIEVDDTCSCEVEVVQG